ncbi:MAG: hypothetical protein CM1200mP39_03410 [Dehalococcoidia bacterium]|nr:MAG: hypothetical protein CM1200mP39_03410 [Dehalococcoidia bacterium]
MAVHVPLSREAVIEAQRLMLSTTICLLLVQDFLSFPPLWAWFLVFITSPGLRDELTLSKGRGR